MTASAVKHGVEDADIQHAGTKIRLVEYDYDGEERLLAIWPDRRHGRVLELVAVPAGEPRRIIQPTDSDPSSTTT